MATKVKYYSPKRRAVYSAGEKIEHVKVFERDNWTCGICRQPINKRLRHPNWRCGTIDHIVPICVALQRGWPVHTIHTYENVQAAHKRCNELKAGTIDLGPQSVLDC